MPTSIHRHNHAIHRPRVGAGGVVGDKGWLFVPLACEWDFRRDGARASKAAHGSPSASSSPTFPLCPFPA